MAIHDLEVWLGPACVGKTTRLLDIYRDQLRANAVRMDLGRTLWLTPTFRAKHQLRRRLLASDPVCFGMNVLTFEEFAEQILLYSPHPVTPLAGAPQHLLLRRIVDRLNEAGQIREYGSISQTRGFLDLVTRTISELKRNEIWPETLRDIFDRSRSRPADREIAAIYAEYQAELLRHHWYDHEGRFWYAAQMLDSGNWGPFPPFSVVVVDGFTDFIETQYRLLDHLLKQTDRLCLTLPADPSHRRPDLFARSERVLERLRKFSTPKEVWISLQSQPSIPPLPPAIRKIADTLFDNPRSIQPTPDSAGLEIWGLTGPRGEVRHLAIRIQQLLREGVRSDQIVVGLRDLENYRDLMDELLTEAGIPYACEASSGLRRAPVIVALLQVFNIVREDWSYSTLLSGLRNDFVQRAWKSGEDFVARLGAFLRDNELIAGKTLILDRISLPGKESTLELQAEREELQYDLNQLAEILGICEKSGTWRQWLGRILHIAGELGISEERRFDPEERRAWRTFLNTLESAVTTADLLQSADETFSLDEFLSELEDLLSVVALQEQAAQEGDVLILDAAQVRHLEVPYLFLLGLTERSFPSRSTESCIYTERDRVDLNSAGVNLTLKDQRLQDEMLLFYGILTRASHHLVLSYPHVDSSGEELNCSPYLEAVRELFDPATLNQTREEHLDPVPHREQILGSRDLRIVATAEVLKKQPGLFAGMLEDPQSGEVSRNLAAAVEMDLRRYHDLGFTSYEGILRNPSNLKYLQEQYGTHREFTVSLLESYAACPFRTFVGETLKIVPHEIPGLGTDHLLRGNILHEVLSQLHLELNTELASGGLIPEQMRAWVAERFVELIDHSFQRRGEFGGVIGTLREIEQEFLNEWSDPYSGQVDVYEQMTAKTLGAPLRPDQFELSFGFDRQTKMQKPPLILGQGATEVRLAGRIDRIDLLKVGDLTLYGLIDYKSGSMPKCDDKTVGSGRSLQLLVYSLAIEELGLLGEQPLLAQVGYWGLRDQGFVSSADTPNLTTREVDEDWKQLMETAKGVVPRLVASLRNGEFPPFNTDESCTSYCPYKTVCRVNQIRPLEESLQKVWGPSLPSAQSPPSPSGSPPSEGYRPMEKRKRGGAR